MGCDFRLRHYQEILENALRAGYVFWHFHEPAPAGARRVVYLRHDLDICVEEAISMAEIEAAVGVSATYFFLVNSPVYNPISAENLEMLRMICSKGHCLGLHIDVSLFPDGVGWEDGEAIEQLIRFYQSYIQLVPVVSFHRPPTSVLGKDWTGFISTYSQRFFRDAKYLSDSKGIWREGCPCTGLAEGTWPIVQILVHPIWWGSESRGQRLRRLLDERRLSFESYLRENLQVDWKEW